LAMSEEPNPEHDAIAWRPTPAYVERSRLKRFMESLGAESTEELQDVAAADVGAYWDRAVRDLGLKWSSPYSAPLDLSRGKAWPRWFVDGGFNWTANALDRWVEAGDGDRTALIWEGDDGEVRTYTFAALLAETERFAAALQQLGVKPGDRVGVFLPMLAETAIAVLALGRIGAIFLPMFSGFGAEAIANRLRDGEASVLICADGTRRRGQVVPMKAVADEAVALAPTVTSVVVLQHVGNTIDWAEGRDVWWHDAVAAAPARPEPVTTRGDDPYMIIYTSGTTGRPKGALHVQAGFPIKAAHDLAYCFDVGPGDTIFWLTDLGWMMGPWLLSALMLGATVVMFSGTPDHPHADRLWQLVERHQVTVLGMAPTAVRLLMGKQIDWVRNRNLSSLRVLGSTGETWNPDPWLWYFREVGGSRCPVINYSGGTETGGGIVGCDVLHPQKPCVFTGPVPGMLADVVDDAGQPVRGKVGELVVREPWVGMTHGFWKDPERYEETYWSRLPGMWVHGDWAEIDEDGFWFIRGRSDDTLKVAGKRIGPAEVESAAVSYPGVQEAAAIGVPHEIKGESVIVFCVLRPEVEASPEMAQGIRQLVAAHLGSAMRPERVVIVRDLPKTRNAKIMRRVIRAAYLGLEAGDTTALENPAAVEEIASKRPVR